LGCCCGERPGIRNYQTAGHHGGLPGWAPVKPRGPGDHLSPLERTNANLYRLRPLVRCQKGDRTSERREPAHTGTRTQQPERLKLMFTFPDIDHARWRCCMVSPEARASVDQRAAQREPADATFPARQKLVDEPTGVRILEIEWDHPGMSRHGTVRA